MESKHTPGPWYLLPTENNRIEIICDKEDIGEYLICHVIDSNCDPQNAANAKRIVACINACESLDDPADLRRQRDEFLAACHSVISWWENHKSDTTSDEEEEYNVYDDGDPEMVTLSLAALARATPKD